MNNITTEYIDADGKRYLRTEAGDSLLDFADEFIPANCRMPSTGQGANVMIRAISLPNEPPRSVMLVQLEGIDVKYETLLQTTIQAMLHNFPWT